MKFLTAWLPNLWSNPLSAFGTVLTTVAGCTLLFLFGYDFSGWNINPYAGAFLLVAVPTLFLLGLVLIPLGAFLAHRRRKQGLTVRTFGEAVTALVTTSKGRRTMAFVGILTVVNIVLLAGAGHRALAWMDSPTFCGTACHTVMQPEYESYRDSPHARVQCVECHIGPGASFFVRSKIDGLRQVWRTITDTYTRPVPTPVHTLRPSRDTCEKCHWPDQFHGNLLEKRFHTRADETNTQEVNVFLLKLGGRDKVTGQYHGIHWHVAQDTEVRYEALDAKRETIGKITVVKDGKVVKEYLPPAAAGEVVETRTMDCIDCHNRPTHVFDITPAQALDRAFASRLLDPAVPWLRKVAEPILAKADRPLETLDAEIRKELEAAYAAEHKEQMPAPEALDAAAKGIANVWRHNVYPLRAVTWGTYPSHLGHQGPTPAKHGCFRCHNDKHKTADGQPLSGDCDLCHEMLAQEEKPEELEEGLRALLK